MATPIGTNVVTTLSRQFIMPDFIDVVYGANVLFWRLNAAGKKIITGGTQIEQPIMSSRFTNGGWYRGFDRLNMAPNDTTRTGAWDWKQAYVPVSVDELTLIKVAHPDAIANFIGLYFAQAEMELAEILADGLWAAPASTKEMDGLAIAVDASNPSLENYGGIDRTTNTWWAATEDSSTTSLSLPALQTMHGAVKYGGRSTTLIVSQQANYDRFWNLNVANQTIMQAPQAYDSQLAAAGFDNMLFNGIPWVVDDHVPDATSVYFLNEDYITLAVNSRSDFTLTDFQAPLDQNAMGARVEWTGNLLVLNPQTQGKFTAIAA